LAGEASVPQAARELELVQLEQGMATVGGTELVLEARR
jgi:hypothetical protein